MVNAPQETRQKLEFQQTSFFLDESPKENSSSRLEETVKKHYAHAEALNSISRNFEETAEKELEAGLEFARQYVNFLRQVVGLPEIHHEQLKVVLQNDEHFVLILDSVLGLGGGADNLGGIYDFPMEHVMVQKSHRWPAYLTASFGLHEFIHLAIDQFVTVYLTEPNNPDAITAHLSRVGLFTSRVIKDSLTGTRERNIEAHLLNELGNYFWQVQFIRDLFASPEGKMTYQKEIAERNKRLKEPAYTGSTAATKITIGSYSPFYLSKENIFFGESNVNFTHAMPFIVRQLVEDLSLLVGPIEGDPLEVSLLLAKREPRLQNTLRRAINAVMGPGFFEKVKRSQVTPANVIPLLLEVQSHLPHLYP